MPPPAKVDDAKRKVLRFIVMSKVVMQVSAIASYRTVAAATLEVVLAVPVEFTVASAK